MENKRVHLIIQGKVQGVFFRASTREKALELGLKGFVRNMEDGSVEIIAEGNAVNLQELIKWCSIGPDRAIVESVESCWHSYLAEYETFTIN